MTYFNQIYTGNAEVQRGYGKAKHSVRIVDCVNVMIV